VSPAERYRAAGVDLDALERAKARIATAVASTRTDLARGLLGAFGGMVRLPMGVQDPTLVMSTDGVGTKVLVALRARRRFRRFLPPWKVSGFMKPRTTSASVTVGSVPP